MTDLTRACADCGSDISERHWRSKRCAPCQAERERIAMNTKPPTLYPRTCEQCGEPFMGARKQARFCGIRCSGLASHPGNVDRVCVVCETTFTISKQYDRDTCSRACKDFAARYPGRKKATDCARCQKPIARKTRRAIYCSYLCAAVAGQARREGRTAAVPRQYCLACGGPIIGKTARALYCSRNCQAMKGHERRAAKIAGAKVERVYPIDIYERDGWTCHLCDLPIDSTRTGRHDPLRVSLDHIVAVAAPGFPGHVWENVAAAHLRCNISKGPKVTARDWDLYRQLRAFREGGSWQPRKPVPVQPPLFNVS